MQFIDFRWREAIHVNYQHHIKIDKVLRYIIFGVKVSFSISFVRSHFKAPVLWLAAFNSPSGRFWVASFVYFSYWQIHSLQDDILQRVWPLAISFFAFDCTVWMEFSTSHFTFIFVSLLSNDHWSECTCKHSRIFSVYEQFKARRRKKNLFSQKTNCHFKKIHRFVISIFFCRDKIVKQIFWIYRSILGQQNVLDLSISRWEEYFVPSFLSPSCKLPFKINYFRHLKKFCCG